MNDEPVLIVVDAANVVGSVPDGWWRDRAGAAERLRDGLADFDATILTGGRPADVVLVVEGRASRVARAGQAEGVRVVAAPGSGDDLIVELVAGASPGRECLVVTADRGLRRRVAAFGVQLAGPGTLHSARRGAAGSPPWRTGRPPRPGRRRRTADEP